MKRIIFSAAILIAALGFTGCENDKNGGNLKIDAKVSNGDLVNSQVDEVRAIGYICVGKYPVDWNEDGIVDWYDCEDYKDITIATAPFKNGGFKMTLPKKIDERLLEPMDFEDALEEMPITVSNKNVKGTAVEDFEAFKNNVNVGYFWCGYESRDTEGYLVYLFVDGNCKISGSFSETEVWDGQTYKMEMSIDLDLKKGWNAVYQYESEVGTTYTMKVSTKKPSFDYTWYYENYSYYNAPKKANKKAPTTFKNLLKIKK